MQDQNKSLRSANELGKIYLSLSDKKALCEFFPQSVALLIDADQGWFYLSGREDKIWLESSTSADNTSDAGIRAKADAVFRSGKPVLDGASLFVPLIVRSSAIGIGCFSRSRDKKPFTAEDLNLAFDLASQMAGALKNIILFEQNLEMEKLAAVGQSMGMVMHEIKNIIQLATFAQEWLDRALRSDDKKYLERGVAGIQKAMREMNGFVYEILSLTKNYTITPQKVNFVSLLKELEEDLTAKAGDIKLDFKVEDGFPEVDAEDRSVYRALLNLVKNSMEACDKEESEIRIRVQSKDQDKYTVIVSDNGIGMSDEVKARMFQAFFSTKGEKGTGLGVMIVDRTIRAHHGKVEIESELGKGTSFILTLPKVILEA